MSQDREWFDGHLMKTLCKNTAVDSGEQWHLWEISYQHGQHEQYNLNNLYYMLFSLSEIFPYWFKIIFSH